MAALLAFVLFVSVAGGGSYGARIFVTTHFDGLLAIMAESKLDGHGDPNKATHLDRVNSLGTTLQQEAFSRRDLLPLYGSSELVRAIPTKANLFFRDHPTGFGVYPVGRPGTDCLLFLQRIASLGEVTNGQRVALSLSPTWFFNKRPTEPAYVSNFSTAQALRGLLSPELSAAFRRDLAARLLLHPSSLESDRLLAFMAHRLANDRWEDRLLYRIAWPLAQLQVGVRTMQDRLEIALYILERGKLPEAPPRAPAVPDWERLIAEATTHSVPNSAGNSPDLTPQERETRDRFFRDCLTESPEWADLDLLLRGLHELHIRTLVLCMPPLGSYYSREGISPESLALFSAQIRAYAERWDAEVDTFDEHGRDLRFQIGHGDHLSERGWMYYNRALDRFYHHAPEPRSTRVRRRT